MTVPPMTTSGTTHFVGDDCQPAHSPRINENVHIEHCECWLDLDRLKAQLAEATEKLRRQDEVVEAARKYRTIVVSFHGIRVPWKAWDEFASALAALDAAVPAASSGDS